MKRIGNLYETMYEFKNIQSAFNEVCSNTRNRLKASRFKEYECINIFRVYSTLKNRTYVPGPYNIFTIYEPKQRRIVSQNMFDKLINHLIARHILMPAVMPSLIDTNVASRPEMGTTKGLKDYLSFRKEMKKKYGSYYILKCDIRKYFASIDHQRLKEKLERRIKDKEALKILDDVINSDEDGLSIGNMTSQILAIFYLNDFDHFVKEELKIRYYVRYQDDFLLFHPSKAYLKECLKKIEAFLSKEKLSMNKKTRIYNSNVNFIFLGRDVYGRYAKYRTANRKLKKRFYFYKNKAINLRRLASSIQSFKHLRQKI